MTRRWAKKCVRHFKYLASVLDETLLRFKLEHARIEAASTSKRMPCIRFYGIIVYRNRIKGGYSNICSVGPNVCFGDLYAQY